jgi:hypothetical protein
MGNAIEVGYQAFVGGGEEFGAIRDASPDEVIVFVENAGDFREVASSTQSVLVVRPGGEFG